MAISPRDRAGLRALQTELDPQQFSRDLSGLLAEIASPEAQSRLIAETARGLEAEADAKNRAALGQVPKKKVFVDGREGAAFDTVRPDGEILIEYDFLGNMIWTIWEMLVLNSPHGDSDTRPGHPGAYSKSHVLFADDTPIAIHRGVPIPVAERYAFCSLVPYARKIERGLSSQSPAGVYEVVSVMMRRRFGNVAAIRFGYMSPSIRMSGIEMWARTASARRLAQNNRGGNAALHGDWLRRQPAIFVDPR